MLLARLPCIKFSPLCAFDGVAEKSCKVGCATDCIGRAAAPLSLIAIKPFCRLPAANHRLAGANYRLVGPYHRLLPPNDKLPKFVSEKGGHVNAKTELIKAETEGTQKNLPSCRQEDRFL